MTSCQTCDTDRSESCSHGQTGRHAAALSSTVVLVAPSGRGHFDGCPNEEARDFSRWGELRVPDAWQRLGSGEALSTTTSAGQPLVATRRCPECADHGPWI